MEHRKLIWWSLSVGILCLAVFLFWFTRPPAIVNYPPREGVVVAFGDSLVYGEGASKGHDFVSVLSGMIGEPIENLGVSGDTTAMGLARVDAAIAIHPRIALLLLGGNDYLRQIPRAQTFENLATLIARFQSDGTIVLLLGVRGGLVIDHFAPDFTALAHRTGTVYVPDVLDGLFGEAQFMSDGVHPNDAGYRLIAQKVFPALSALLR